MMLQADDFWHYSLRVYPQIADTLLTLQDEAGIEVNLLLMALWLNSKQQALGIQHWQQLLQAIAPQRAEVSKRRAKRRGINKAQALPDYQQALQHELEAEKLLQKALVAAIDLQWLQPHSPQSNVLAAATACQQHITDDHRMKVQQLLKS